MRTIEVSVIKSIIRTNLQIRNLRDKDYSFS
jgi:hypothetical protein